MRNLKVAATSPLRGAQPEGRGYHAASRRATWRLRLPCRFAARNL